MDYLSKAQIYLAAPLFCPMERSRNANACARLEEAGFKVFLPQRDAGEATKGTPRKQLFRTDTQAVLASDALVAFIDGRVPDEGTVFEMGMAYAADIPIVVFCTDDRSFMDGHPNVMLEYAGKWVSTIPELLEYLEHIVGGPKNG